MKKENYLQGNSEHPAHVSVGAVVRNANGEICCHHFIKDNLSGYWVDENLDDFYLLMRETMHPNETLEEALHRGLMEEFGITTTLDTYIGSIQSHFTHKGVTIEKTTLYFLCTLVSQDLSKRDTADVEGKTDVEWHTMDFLIPKMKMQAKKFGRTDVDESLILERFKSTFGI